MNKKILFFLLSLIIIQSASMLSAEENYPDLTQYTDLTNNPDLGIVFQENFENNDISWTPKPGFVMLNSEGINNSGSMYYERTDPNDYPIITALVNLKENRRYKVCFKVRLENIVQHGAVSNGEFGAVFFNKDNSYYGGAYSHEQFDLSSTDWQEVNIIFEPKAGFETAYIALYMMRDYTGKIWWDDVKIEEVNFVPGEIFSHWPKNLKTNDYGYFQFGGISYYDPMPQEIAMLLEIGDNKLVLNKPAADLQDNSLLRNFFNTSIEGLPYGEITINTYLTDPVAKNILAQKEFKFYNPQPLNTSNVDEYGRTLVDGQPFMPIGMFGHALTASEITHLKNNGFNCFMPYWSVGMTPSGEFSYNNTFANLDTCLQMYMENNIKVLFCLKSQVQSAQYFRIDSMEGITGYDNVTRAVVERYKDHKAILGWYLADEASRDEVDIYKNLREMVNETDSNHITLSLTYKERDFVHFASACDILIADPYPIISDSAAQNMKNVSGAFKAIRRIYMPSWISIQAFSFAVENPDGAYRWPTAKEICSIALAGAVNNAKGFFFYSHSFIFKYAPDPAAEFAKVTQAVNMLHGLEPFILSTQSGPEVVVDSTVSGKVELKSWKATVNGNDQIRIGVVGVDSGNNEGIFTVSGYNNLSSTTGKTINLGNGQYRFKDDHISYDILYVAQ